MRPLLSFATPRNSEPSSTRLTMPAIVTDKRKLPSSLDTSSSRYSGQIMAIHKNVASLKFG